MNLYKIVFSPTGGTDKVANIILSAISEKYIEIDLTDVEKYKIKKSFDREDVCLFAVPSYGGRVPNTVSERIKDFKGNGAKAIIVTVYGNREFEDTLVELEDMLEKMDFSICAGISAIAKHSIITEFASERPDEDDVKELYDMGRKIKEKLENGETGKPEIPGNRPYKIYNPLPIGILVDDTCTECGLCAEKCPVHAIDEDKPSSPANEECISCMRCVSICPSNSRRISEEKYNFLKNKIGESCKIRKQNRLYI